MAPTDVDHKKFLLFPSIFPSHSVDISFWLHRRSSSSSKRKMRRKQPKKGGNSLKRKLKSSRCKTIYWNFSTSQLSTNGQVTFFNFSLSPSSQRFLSFKVGTAHHTLVKLSKIVWGVFFSFGWNTKYVCSIYFWWCDYDMFRHVIYTYNY